MSVADTDWYAHEVFTKTSKLSEQIFPITLDIDNPRWEEPEGLQKANVDLADAKNRDARWHNWVPVSAGLAFVGLFTIPSKKHAVPAKTRLEPAY